MEHCIEDDKEKYLHMTFRLINFPNQDRLHYLGYLSYRLRV